MTAAKKNELSPTVINEHIEASVKVKNEQKIINFKFSLSSLLEELISVTRIVVTNKFNKSFTI